MCKGFFAFHFYFCDFPHIADQVSRRSKADSKHTTPDVMQGRILDNKKDSHFHPSSAHCWDDTDMDSNALNAWVAGTDRIVCGATGQEHACKQRSTRDSQGPSTSSGPPGRPPSASAAPSLHTRPISAHQLPGCRFSKNETVVERPIPDSAAPFFARDVTCDMSLRILNIPEAMHQRLGLVSAYPRVNGRRAKRCTVYISSPGGYQHSVTMVSKTNHRRLTDGWRSFCESMQLRVGDTIHFYSTNLPNELHVNIVRRAASYGVHKPQSGLSLP